MHQSDRNKVASNPKDLEGSAHALEGLVTRDQRCLPGLGEGGGEAIGVGQVVLRLETGGQLAEFHVNADNLNGKLGDLMQLGVGGFFPARAPDRVVKLAPVDYRHRERVFGLRRLRQQFLDLVAQGDDSDVIQSPPLVILSPFASLRVNSAKHPRIGK